MAYRYSATGSLDVPPKFVDRVCSILESRSITYERSGNTLHIKHAERARTASHSKPEDTFAELARYIDRPQSITVNSELLGELQVGFVGGSVRTDVALKVWSTAGEAPTPDTLVDELKRRGIAARVSSVRGSRKSGQRTRVFEIEPGSGGPACRVTIRTRFWDSYDLLSVPDVYDPLCRKYHITPQQLRENLHTAKFGVEVRLPALGGPSSHMLFENLLDIIEDRTEGIRTELG